MNTIYFVAGASGSGKSVILNDLKRLLGDDSWDGLIFERWDTLDSWNSLANITILDITQLSVAQVAEAVKNWIDLRRD